MFYRGWQSSFLKKDEKHPIKPEKKYSSGLEGIFIKV
jgi:hypothetical protein